MGRCRTAAVGILGATVWMSAGITNAAEIQVIASGGLKAAYLELVPSFERTSAHRVSTTWAGSVEIKKRMESGDIFDLVIMPAAFIDELIGLGKVVPGSRADLAKSGIGVAVRAGAPRPDIGSGEALRRALLFAGSIAYSTSASGIYLADLFQRMGIADALQPKIKQSPPGVPVGEMIARGEAEIGFQQVSELLPVSGIDYLGPLPTDIQHFTVFAAGRHIGTREPDAAKALIDFIKAPAAHPIITKSGMEPA
ncbi:MAG: ABC transporter substrate-binding protein [Alphaproteobacteria bacterium]|nr:MAG: ABC transporter substrate-binding protein [Alphaproteobacteria bacterium]